MKVKKIQLGDRQISQILSYEVLIKDTQDALDLMGEVWGDEYLMLYEYNFEKDFFDLSTRKLGDVFQKFANYQIKLAIIGDFDKYPSKTLKDFIFESNKHGDYLFVPSLEEVKNIWKK